MEQVYGKNEQAQNIPFADGNARWNFVNLLSWVGKHARRHARGGEEPQRSSDARSGTCKAAAFHELVQRNLLGNAHDNILALR